MKLLLGAPGSGKTTRLLAAASARLRAGERIRYLVPTATMAAHLRHQLARGGLAFPASSIATMAEFLEERLSAPRAAEVGFLTLTAAGLLERFPHAGFGAAADTPGFRAAALGAVTELATAGCDSLRLEALCSMRILRGAEPRALAAFYARLEEALRGAGTDLRPARLAAAARQIRASGAAGLSAVYCDGFFQFTLAEQALIEALAAHVPVTVALPSWPGARRSIAAFERAGAAVETLQPVRATPVIHEIPAPSRGAEAEDIARRILAAHAAGRAWRSIGVIVRSEQPYVPLLRTTFERFGVPARFYFAPPLGAAPAARFLSAAVAAVLAGWEHSLALAAFSNTAANFAACPAWDAFQIAVREALPGAGLARLGELAAARAEFLPFVRLIQDLAETANWPAEQAAPGAWAERLVALLHCIAGPHSSVSPALAAAWRERAAACAALAGLLRQTAEWTPAAALPLADFWRRVRLLIDAAPLRVPGRRRDVVHVMDVYEARQWELPVVFVCGLIEGEFPRHAAAEPFLGEAARLRLQANGVPVSTQSERQQEERWLLELARTRATTELYLSWPALNEKGDPNLRSFDFPTLGVGRSAARPARPAPLFRAPALAPAALSSADLLAAVRQAHATLSATALESFLACPYLFFARHTLALASPDDDPARRLDFLAQGSFLHCLLRCWHATPGPIAPLFEREWTFFLRRQRIPAGYRTELARLRLLRLARLYAADPHLRAGWQVYLEEAVTLAREGYSIRGHVDRYDVSPAGECAVIDFKLSSAASVRQRKKETEAGRYLQAGLYPAALLAAGRQVTSFHYVALSGVDEWHGWRTPEEIAALIGAATAQADGAAAAIHSGSIDVDPYDRKTCERCDFAAACRIATLRPAAAAAGGEDSA